MIVSSVSTSKMEEVDAVSLASIKMKDTAYSVTSEPPPFYKERSNSTALRITRLIAATVISVAFILGAAIILAAYLQQVRIPEPVVTVSQGDEDVMKTSALTGEEPPAAELEKSHRRLDTEQDLLEDFLENEGKILRLPQDDSQLDISHLAKMFLKRNQAQQTKCFVERRPINDNSNAIVQVIPIDPQNMVEDSIRVSGQSVSIICNTDVSEMPSLSGLIMPSPMMLQAPMPTAAISVMMRNGDVPELPRQMRPPMPSVVPRPFLGASRPMRLPLMPMRTFFPQDRLGSSGPYGFPLRPFVPSGRSMPGFRRPIFRNPGPRSNFLPFDDSAEVSDSLHNVLDFQIPQRLIHTPNFRKQQKVIIEEADESEGSEDSSESTESNESSHPVSRFRVPVANVDTKIPSRVLTPPIKSDNVPRPLPIRTAPGQTHPVPITLRQPITLPFLHVPKRMDSIVQRPLVKPTQSSGSIRPERITDAGTLFERLMDSLIGHGRRTDRNQSEDQSKGTTEKPSESSTSRIKLMPSPLVLNLSARNGAPNSRSDPLIARGLRLPLAEPNFQNVGKFQQILRRPIDGLSAELNSPQPLARADLGGSHSIQPRSLTEN